MFYERHLIYRRGTLLLSLCYYATQSFTPPCSSALVPLTILRRAKEKGTPCQGIICREGLGLDLRTCSSTWRRGTLLLSLCYYASQSFTPPRSSALVPLTILRGAKEKVTLFLDCSALGYHLQRGPGTGSENLLIHLENPYRAMDADAAPPETMLPFTDPPLSLPEVLYVHPDTAPDLAPTPINNGAVAGGGGRGCTLMAKRGAGEFKFPR